MVLIFDFLDLHELVVDHLFCVLQDPLPDLRSVHLLGLLAHLSRVRLLLLVDLGSFLHGDYLFVLALGLDISLGLLALDSVQLTLLSCKFTLQICLLFRQLLLHARPVLSLLLDLLHHRDLLRLHLADL